MMDINTVEKMIGKLEKETPLLTASPETAIKSVKRETKGEVSANTSVPKEIVNLSSTSLMNKFR